MKESRFHTASQPGSEMCGGAVFTQFRSRKLLRRRTINRFARQSALTPLSATVIRIMPEAFL